MRRLKRPLLMVFCGLALASCAKATNMSERSVSAVPTKPEKPEKQKIDARAILASYVGTEVDKRRGDIRITIPCDTLFKPDSEKEERADWTEIDRVAEVARAYPDMGIRVDVYTDCVHSEEINLALTQLQAWLIKKALVDRGIAASRIRASGWGETRPVASNATAEGRKMNRRVTIRLDRQS